jgi:hypothetical protein
VTCNGVETCDGAGTCQPGTPLTSGSSCEDGLFCNGAETCDGAGSCQAGGDPCPGQSCNEAGDVCVVAQLESGTLALGSTSVTVALSQSYSSPVVVSTVQYNNNTSPVVTRISNVTSTSFDIRLQNPSDSSVAMDNVYWMVVEEGAWTIDGVSVEAQTYLSTVTDGKVVGWNGETQSYLQSYTNPVVLGQVMSENDSQWSVFWSRAAGTCSEGVCDPPSATSLITGKAVGGDPSTTRSDETVGFIVFETGHGTIGGVEFEAALGPETVQGVTDTSPAPPYLYTFASPFATAPTIGLATQAAMVGQDGSWAQIFGATVATTTELSLSVDEDQVEDTERFHVAEQVSYVVFATPVIFGPGG